MKAIKTTPSHWEVTTNDILGDKLGSINYDKIDNCFDAITTNDVYFLGGFSSFEEAFEAIFNDHK